MQIRLRVRGTNSSPQRAAQFIASIFNTEYNLTVCLCVCVSVFLFGYMCEYV